MSDTEQAGKECLATYAASYVEEFYKKHQQQFETRPMVLGVGSGSTVAMFMSRLTEIIGPFIADKKISFILCVPTSRQAEALILQHAYDKGKQVLQLSSLNANPVVDLIIDGADEVHLTETSVHMLKGGGGAMLMEKIVAMASKDRLYLVTNSKLASIGLGEKRVPIPIEVIPDAYCHILKALFRLFPDYEAYVRQAPGGKAGPVITDNGHMIIDLKAPSVFDPVSIASALDRIPGIVGHGIFSIHIDLLYIADGSQLIIKDLMK